MLSHENIPFDAIAHNYDDVFSKSLIGYHQRQITRRYLQKFLSGKPSLRILEINCGTGEDAIWLASLGHQVIATDQSERMISVAREKIDANVQTNNPTFLVCDFEQLDAKFPTAKFDLVFSNFSGLNCVSEIELSQLSLHLHALLKKAGAIALVIFGKYSWWETLYYSCKADFTKAFRRWHNQKIATTLSKNVVQDTYYYSIRKFTGVFNQFEVKQKKPVGLFVPPSYLERFVQKNKRIFNLLLALEKVAGSITVLSPFADHVYMLLKKK